MIETIINNSLEVAYKTTCEICEEQTIYKGLTFAKQYEKVCLQCQKHPDIVLIKGRWCYPCKGCGRAKTFKSRRMAIINQNRVTKCHKCNSLNSGKNHKYVIKHGGSRNEDRSYTVYCPECHSPRRCGHALDASNFLKYGYRTRCAKCTTDYFNKSIKMVDDRKEAEEWKVIPKKFTAHNYSISNYGRIRNDKNGYILKPLVNSTTGYATVFLGWYCDAGKKKPFAHYIHRMVAYIFVPRPMRNISELEVNHINLDKSDNRAVNLEWVSPKKNVRHAALCGVYKSNQKQ